MGPIKSRRLVAGPGHYVQLELPVVPHGLRGPSSQENERARTVESSRKCLELHAAWVDRDRGGDLAASCQFLQNFSFNAWQFGSSREACGPFQCFPVEFSGFARRCSFV